MFIPILSLRNLRLRLTTQPCLHDYWATTRIQAVPQTGILPTNTLPSVIARSYNPFFLYHKTYPGLCICHLYGPRMERTTLEGFAICSFSKTFTKLPSFCFLSQHFTDYWNTSFTALKLFSSKGVSIYISKINFKGSSLIVEELELEVSLGTLQFLEGVCKFWMEISDLGNEK